MQFKPIAALKTKKQTSIYLPREPAELIMELLNLNLLHFLNEQIFKVSAIVPIVAFSCYDSSNLMTCFI